MRRFTGLVAATGLLCLGIVVGIAFNSAAPAQEKAGKAGAAPAVQKWEYKVVNKHLDEKNLNELGEEGWEFAISYTGGLGSVYEIYKRPKR